VIRHTEPAFASYLPPTHVRQFSGRGNFLVYLADRGSGLQAYALDLKNFASRQLTDAKAFDPSSITLTPDDRGLCYADGNSIMWIAVGSSSARELYQREAGAPGGSGLSVTADGPSALFVEKANLLRRVLLTKGTPVTIAEGDAAISDPQPRPRRASVLYRAGGALHLTHLDGSETKRLPAADGKLGQACWSPDGRTVLYIRIPSDSGRANELRELDPDTGSDKLVAVTTQFIRFAPNRDSSVFAGASQSKASPYVLLLLRAARREFSLCEHGSSTPEQVGPVFSPDSQRVFFQSDRHGKPAIYSIRVEKLVEKTS
jgi:oligogalacturonide lyase